MASSEVVFFREADGHVPVLEWLDSLEAGALDQCNRAIHRLRELGFELRRPVADYLRDGIYELRGRHRGVQYRMLYFFFGRRGAVVTHGFKKLSARVPNVEIERALRMKRAFEADPAHHTHGESR